MSQVNPPRRSSDVERQGQMLDYLQKVLQKQVADLELARENLSKFNTSKNKKRWGEELHAREVKRQQDDIDELNTLIPTTREQIRELQAGRNVPVVIPRGTDPRQQWMFINYYRPSRHGRMSSPSPGRGSASRPATGPTAAASGSGPRGRQQQRGPHHDSKHRGASRTKCAVM